MRQEVSNLIRKARKSLGAARELFNSKYYDFSVSRAYYSMFYCVEALLLTKSLSFSKHSASIANFGKHFIKTGLLPSNLLSYVSDAFKDRQRGDYEALDIISKEGAETHLRNAEEFLVHTIKYLKTHNKSQQAEG